MSKLLKEWLFACRILVKSPFSTATAILVLAIAIGANSAIYTLTDNLSVTVPAGSHADEVYLVGAGPRDPQSQYFVEFDGAVADPLIEGSDSFQSLAKVSQSWVSVSKLETPLRIQALSASAGFLRIVGVSAAAGRSFEEEDFQPGGILGAMITRQTWLDGWGGAQDAIGALVDINGRPHRIVGVLPDSFSFERRGFGILLASTFEQETFEERAFPFLFLAGRLKSGISESQALAEIKALEETVKDQGRYPRLWDSNTLDIKKLNQQGNSFVQTQINILLAVGLIILLIAAFNVTNLTLARLNQRGAEYATRAAMGASRWDLFRISLHENGTIVSLGYLLGVGTGYGLMQIVTTRFAGAQWGLLQQLNDDLALNGRVLLYTGLACLLALLVISLSTLYFSKQSQIGSLIKQDSRSATGSRAFKRITSGLLFTKIAFTCSLLIIGAFFVVSLRNINKFDYGFKFEGVVRGNLNLPFYNFEDGGGDPANMIMLEDVLQEIRSVPGVEAASFSKLRFPHWGFYWWVKTRNTPPDLEGDDLPQSWKGVVYPGYLELIGMRLIQGDTFRNVHNVADGENVTIVNQAFANAHFPGANPIGEYVETNLMGEVRTFRIIGVVSNLNRWWRDDETEPTMYFVNSADANSRAWSWIYLKAPRWNGSVERAVREAIHRVDREIVIAEFVDLDEGLKQSQSSFRFIVFIQSLVSTIGFALSCAGIYSAMSYSVAQRRREMGIRLALGAQPNAIRNRILASNGMLLLPAILIGIAASFIFLVPLDSFADQLYLVNPADYRIYGAVGFSLLTVGLVAALQPALRAARVDPNRALREL